MLKDKDGLAANFFRASHMMGRGMFFHRRMPDAQMHQGQGRLLATLQKMGPVRQSELVERMDVRPSSLSELLSKLEEKELISRKQDEEDRRTMIVSLTEKGEEMAKNEIGVRDEMAEKMFAALSDEEQEQLNGMLQKLLTSWKEEFGDVPHHRPAERGRHDGHGRHGGRGRHDGHRKHGRHGGFGEQYGPYGQHKQCICGDNTMMHGRPRRSW